MGKGRWKIIGSKEVRIEGIWLEKSIVVCLCWVGMGDLRVLDSTKVLLEWREKWRLRQSRDGWRICWVLEDKIN